MRFDYCPKCGRKAVLRKIGDEGDMPYCEGCERPLFDLFPVCVLCAVINEQGEAALIRQTYGDTERFVGVAGYIKSGESAEETAAREVAEETGLTALSVQPLKSFPYPQKDMLMLGFLVRAAKADFTLSGEVGEARWFPLSEAVKTVRDGSIIQKVLICAEEALRDGQK